MADPLHSPPSPPPPPPHPKPSTPPAGKSPNKRKNTTAVGTNSPANKRPNIDPINPAIAVGTDEDTATSKRKVIEQEVDVDDIEIMEGLLDYRSRKGIFPFENQPDMMNFLRPWLILHIGNLAGWKTKLQHVKTKYTNASDPIEDGKRKEFELWKKIWGNEGGDQSGGS